jgi:hypothetical protein
LVGAVVNAGCGCASRPGDGGKQIGAVHGARRHRNLGQVQGGFLDVLCRLTVLIADLTGRKANAGGEHESRREGGAIGANGHERHDSNSKSLWRHHVRTGLAPKRKLRIGGAGAPRRWITGVWKSAE